MAVHITVILLSDDFTYYYDSQVPVHQISIVPSLVGYGLNVVPSNCSVDYLSLKGKTCLLRILHSVERMIWKLL